MMELPLTRVDANTKADEEIRAAQEQMVTNHEKTMAEMIADH
jgi:hypothetical protein